MSFKLYYRIVLGITRPVHLSHPSYVKRRSTPVTDESPSVSPTDLAFDSIQIKTVSKGKQTQNYIESKGERGKAAKINVDIFGKNDFHDLEDIIDFDEVIRRIQVTFDQDLERIKNVRPGFEAETIGELPVLYDGDLFILSDLATIASARNIVKASVAGCPELIMPITHACQENF